MAFKGGMKTPTNLTATADGQTEVDVSWTASASGVTYQLQRNGATIVSQSGTTYTDTGRAPGTTYVYRVRAVKGGSQSSWSATKSATTDAVPSPSLTVFDMMGNTPDRPANPLPGMTRALDINEGFYYDESVIFPPASNRQAAPIDTARITQYYADRTNLTMLIDDIEQILAPNYYNTHATEVQAKMAQVDAAAFVGDPNIPRSFYSGNPTLEWVYTQVYQRTHEPTKTYYNTWKTRNAQMAVACPNVLAFTLKMYVQYEEGVGGHSKTRDDILNEWTECANEMLANARLNNANVYGSAKPIHIILWPQYKDSGNFIDLAFWQFMCEWSRDNGLDAIIIWGGHGPMPGGGTVNIGVDQPWYAWTVNTFIPGL